MRNVFNRRHIYIDRLSEIDIDITIITMQTCIRLTRKLTCRIYTSFTLSQKYLNFSYIPLVQSSPTSFSSFALFYCCIINVGYDRYRIKFNFILIKIYYIFTSLIAQEDGWIFSSVQHLFYGAYSKTFHAIANQYMYCISLW